MPHADDDRWRMPRAEVIGSRRGFTLVELVTVIGIIIVLSSIMYGSATYILEKARRDSSLSLVQAVQTAAVAYQAQYGSQIMVMVSGKPQARRLWDINADELLDENPTMDGAASSLTAIAPAGYGGFLDATGIQVKASNTDGRRAIIDAWKRQLRIIFRPDGFGTQSFGVFSTGKDGIAAPDDDASDDLRGW
jgi:prepilin-type N-terminal cleavage/methylation domain-containing protein